MKVFVSVTAGVVLLLVLAMFMDLTGTAALVITLAVLAAVILGLFRLVLVGTEDIHKMGPRR
jgi:VIT1/CCC1 family predicted Fe2+/Mn2+ transporter